MKVSALLNFVSWISIMLRPTQAEGEFENILTFSSRALKSHFVLSYFVYPNIHLPGLSSQTLPHNRVEFVVFSSHHLFFSFMFSSGYSYFPLFMKTDILKFQYDQAPGVCLFVFFFIISASIAIMTLSLNSPFPSCLKPLYQSEAWCAAIHGKRV